MPRVRRERGKSGQQIRICELRYEPSHIDSLISVANSIDINVHVDRNIPTSPRMNTCAHTTSTSICVLRYALRQTHAHTHTHRLQAYAHAHPSMSRSREFCAHLYVTVRGMKQRKYASVTSVRESLGEKDAHEGENLHSNICI